MKASSKLPYSLLGITLSCLAFSSYAAKYDNCYAAGKVPAERQIYKSSAVLMLDETVVFDVTQHDHIRKQAERLLAYGNELRIFTFSAYRDGRYTLPVLEVRLAMQLEESVRYTMRKDSVREFDTCQQASMNNAKQQLSMVLTNYFGQSSSDLANSDILGTLKEIGESVFPALRSKNTRLILVSDMLENSGKMSFYGAGGVPRAIDSSAELKMVDNLSLVSDFRGASVYVIGAGVAPIADKKSGSSYRSQAIMLPLKKFWTQYFEKSNAKIVEFGQPLLLTPIGGDK